MMFRNLATFAPTRSRIILEKRWSSTAFFSTFPRFLSTSDGITNGGSSYFTLAAATGLALSSLLVAAAATEQISNKRTKLEAAFAPDGNKSSTASVTIEGNQNDSKTTVLNWSGTHAVVVDDKNYWEPETIEDVEAIVKKCHKLGKPVRPIGAALSPNGLAFNSQGMISMANLDQVVSIDEANMTVTVQAGTRVSEVIEALRPFNLTLPNLASIAEQQVGGFIQVGAHGTGKSIAPVDHYVTKLKMVTPSQGTIELTEEDGDLFHMAKVAMGCLGIVVEVTMKCVPAHNLIEHTYVLTRQEAKEQVNELLANHKHVRYMWIPFEDVVVVVTNDPEDQVSEGIPQKSSQMDDEERLRPLADLLMEIYKGSPQYTPEVVKTMGFGDLRDALVSYDPLNIEHIKRVNKAEAEFWRRSEGYQKKPSDQLLQFDCGGQQWVWEVCFPTGSQEVNNGNDMKVVSDLMAGIEERNIPAPAPVEQRWTAASSSLMSPAGGAADGLHSWIGIIHYLPLENEGQRRDITSLFKTTYCDLLRDVGAQAGATSHWAKLEIPTDVWKIIDLRTFMESRFPVTSFNQARGKLDPKSILSNSTIDMALGKPGSK